MTSFSHLYSTSDRAFQYTSKDRPGFLLFDKIRKSADHTPVFTVGIKGTNTHAPEVLR
jgi:hypothetical protein